MQTIWSQQNWFKNNASAHRLLIVFVVSVLVISIVLMIPVRKVFDTILETKSITVELIKPKPKIISPIIKPIVPKIEQKTEKINTPESAKKPVAKSAKKPVKKVVKSQSEPLKKTKAKPEQKLPSSGKILSTLEGKTKLFHLDESFQARKDNPNDFKYKVIEQPEWNKVTKLIDEELDKPQYEMNFYSEGIVGATERFFDKVTIEKTFTTRYGTKIYCRVVTFTAVLGVCSWK